MILVPIQLESLSPSLFRQAGRAATQVEADRIIRVLIPDWTGDTMNCKAWDRHVGVDRHQAQAASTYSLDHCQGGGRYFEPSPDRPTGEIGEHYAVHGVVDVPEEVNVKPIPTRKRVKKSYLPQFDPRKQYEVECKEIEPHTFLADM